MPDGFILKNFIKNHTISADNGISVAVLKDFANTIDAVLPSTDPTDKWKVDSPMFSISVWDLERRKSSPIKSDISFEIEHREVSA